MNDEEVVQRVSSMHEKIYSWLETKDQIEDRHPSVMGTFHPENIKHLGSGCLLLTHAIVDLVRVTPPTISKYLRERE